MANTYVLIASNTLGASAASVTFSSIPATYTDLVLKVSVRSDDAGSFGVNGRLRFNGITTTTHSWTYISGNGATASSSRVSNQSYLESDTGVTSAANTSNTFASLEICIPSYTQSQNKPLGINQASESNATTAYIFNGAGLWRNTAAINQIEYYPSIGNWVSGSSFFLYGIKAN